jgi:hypothetical protein
MLRSAEERMRSKNVLFGQRKNQISRLRRIIRNRG